MILFHNFINELNDGLRCDNVSHFVLVIGMVYLFKSIYIQKLTTLLLSQAVAQSDEKKSIVGEAWWAI